MKNKIPIWALETASPSHRQRAEEACRNHTCQITWPDRRSIRDWARQHGWPVSWINFKARFIKKMLETDAAFALALNESGVKVRIPLQHYVVSNARLKAFDALYEEREDMGALGLRPTGWGALVEDLRELRRAIEAGVVIEIDGREFKGVGGFLRWAHGRYHLLEDGYDSWIGDDIS